MQPLLDALNQPRAMIFGHRGASSYAPMNTLPAFELAAEIGADGVELDAQLSKDGHVVIMHNDTVDETTDGRGRVRDFPLKELKKLNAGYWFAPEYNNVRIPTLDQVFVALGKQLFINIELKDFGFRGSGLEEAVAACIMKHQMEERVIVSSFNPFSLRRFRAAAPQIMVGYLHHPYFKPYIRHLLFGLPHHARHPFHTVIDASYMAWAKKKGYHVNTWTVNDPLRAVELRDLGVRIIITDKPDIIRQALD